MRPVCRCGTRPWQTTIAVVRHLQEMIR